MVRMPEVLEELKKDEVGANLKEKKRTPKMRKSKRMLFRSLEVIQSMMMKQ